MPGHPASPGHPVRWLLALLLACPAAALESGAVQATLGVDGRGRVLQVEQFRGRLLVVSLWASWCSSCLDELRALDELRRRHGDERIAILAMNAGETEGAVAAMAARLEPHGLSLTRVDEVDSALFPDAGVP